MMDSQSELTVERLRSFIGLSMAEIHGVYLNSIRARHASYATLASVPGNI